MEIDTVRRDKSALETDKAAMQAVVERAQQAGGSAAAAAEGALSQLQQEFAKVSTELLAQQQQAAMQSAKVG